MIATHYDPEKPTYKLEIRRDPVTGEKLPPVRTDLKQNGDFRSPECVELLKECDVVVTNPPFSLFREYVAQLMQYEKKFIIIGNKNSITYKEFFPLLKENKVWIGYGSPCEFGRPDGTLTKQVNGLSRWFTNIDIKKRHEPLTLFRRYADDPSKYPKYNNYDAINVDKVQNIPEDYDGVMGVPVTFLDKYCPEQFEILGLSVVKETMPVPTQLGEQFIVAYRNQGGTGHFSPNMYGLCYFDGAGKAKVPYGRILVRRKL